MPFDGALSASTTTSAKRVDMIAAGAHEAGLWQASVVLAQMADLLRAIGGGCERAAVIVAETSQSMIAT